MPSEGAVTVVGMLAGWAEAGKGTAIRASTPSRPLKNCPKGATGVDGGANSWG